jgi:hypothetical protein
MGNWPGSGWIVYLIIDTPTRVGNHNVRRYLLLSSVRTTPEALLRLIWQLGQGRLKVCPQQAGRV